jgi:ubiquinone/menaquinone biosynthesis C-methylase UbiE
MSTLLTTIQTSFHWIKLRFFTWAGIYDYMIWIILGKQNTINLRMKTVELIQIKSQDKILDIGSGTGQLAVGLYEKNPDGMIYGVDISQDMIEIATLKVTNMRINNKISFHKTDGKKLPFENESMTVVVSSLAFHHIENGKTVLLEAFRVLEKGGRLIIVDYGKEQHQSSTSRGEDGWLARMVGFFFHHSHSHSHGSSNSGHSSHGAESHNNLSSSSSSSSVFPEQDVFGFKTDLEEIGFGHIETGWVLRNLKIGYISGVKR